MGQTDYVSKLKEQIDQEQITMKVRIEKEPGTYDIPVSKADVRFFPLNYRGDESGNTPGIVSEVQVDNGCKFITLRSIMKVANHYSHPVDIYKDNERLAVIQPNDHYHVPIEKVYKRPYEFRFRIHGQDQTMSLESFSYSLDHYCSEAIAMQVQLLPYDLTFLNFNSKK